MREFKEFYIFKEVNESEASPLLKFQKTPRAMLSRDRLDFICCPNYPACHGTVVDRIPVNGAADDYPEG